MSADVYPPNFGTDRGKVRALIPDVEQVDFSGEGEPTYLFSDGHIDALLMIFARRPSRILRAAAAALRAIAVSEGMISKVIKTEDLQTDGAKLAAALMVGAKQLEDAADKEDADPDDCYGEDGFQIVDFQAQPYDCVARFRGFPGGACGSCGGGGGGGVGGSGGCGSCGGGENYNQGSGFGRWAGP